MVILTWRIEERPRKFVTYKLIGGYFEGTLPKKKQFSVLHEFEGIFGPDRKNHICQKRAFCPRPKNKNKKLIFSGNFCCVFLTLKAAIPIRHFENVISQKCLMLLL